MEQGEVHQLIASAIDTFMQRDRFLLEHNAGERCIAARIAMHLQGQLPEWDVDPEYNRILRAPKRLELPAKYTDYQDEQGRSFVVPDIIVHKRGPDGPNLLVVELKKTSHQECRRVRDRVRIAAFKEQLRYTFGCLLVCETRLDHVPGIETEWIA